MTHPTPGGRLERLRRVAGAVESSSEAVLTVRMLGWGLVLRVLKRVVPLERLVRVVAIEPRHGPRDLGAERRIGRLARLAHRGSSVKRRDNCLERSLVAYRYLTAANAAPVLVVGARAGDAGIEGHVWLTVDGEPIHDAQAALDLYTPVMTFGADGRARSLPDALP